MKKKICFIWTLLAAMLFINTAGAQFSTYERTPGYYTLGINGGVAYQQGDIPTTLDGYGFGFTLGKNLYYKPGALFSFDVRGRALYSQTFGQDYFRSYGIQENDALNGINNLDYTVEAGGPGFVFQNNKTHLGELGIEGVINFNKLREQTNVIFSLYGGIGLDWYYAQTDQANRVGLYTDQYLALDTLSSVSYLKSQLKNNILDGDYESSATDIGSIGIMPSLGVELGYQFTPRFSMGVGHKMTFTKTDLFDGHQWKDNGNLTGDDDIHHYTNLHMRWIIDDNSKKLRAPIVDITNPSLSPHTTRSNRFDIRATVKNISSAMDIDFTVNGYRETFDFRKNDFKSNIRLQPGNNIVVITASNDAGSDRDEVNIYYEEPIIDIEPDYAYPEVQITNPPYDDYRTDEQRFNVRADIRNVRDSRDIQFTVNGREETNFDYRNGSFIGRADLNPGRNTVRIQARNSDGLDSDERTIILEDITPVRRPSVDITKPSVDPYETNRRTVTVDANIYNVQDRNDISYTINGYTSTDFDFYNNVFSADIDLNNNRTTVVVTARNNAGEDSDQVTILWEEEEEPQIEKPVVTITSTSQPTADPFDPTNCRSTVIATILNIDDRNDIDVWVNGQHFTDYDFNNGTQVFRATVRLEQGTNQIRIKASNTAGFDEATTSTEGCTTQPDDENPPVVNITQPTRDNQKFTNPSTVIKAEIDNVTIKNAITFTLNGTQTNNFAFDKFTGVLSANVTLEPGTNTVVIEAQNTDGTASDRINLIYDKIIISRPPSVTIEQPKNNSTVEVATVNLLAEVLHVGRKQDIDVFLNGKLIDFNLVKNDVQATLNLEEGNNTIRVVGSNAKGTDEASVRVRFLPPAPVKPIVKIIKPKANTVVNAPKVSLLAEVRNVRSKSDIQVLLNGKAINNFSFQGKEVIANLNLRLGKNTILVKASNNDGTAQDRVNLTYAKVEVPPTVNINKPRNNSKVSDPKVSLLADVRNVRNLRDIQVLLNGKTIKNFSFKGKDVKANLNLRAGKNTIQVKASNEDGNAQDQVTITYEKLETPPTVKIVTPKDNQTFEVQKTQLTANITGVDSQRKLTLKVNGKSQNFNYASGKLTATITLQKGRNTIRVKGTNGGGSDEASVQVIYTPKVVIPKPDVRFTTPSRPGTVSKKAKFTIKGVAKNVKEKRDVVLKFNGIAINNFSFNTRTKAISATVTLKDGKNEMSIEGTNASGKDKELSNVVYKKTVVVKNPPKVTIVSVSNPTVDPFDPDKAKSTVIAQITNINSKRDITFTFNGKKINSYSYNRKTGALTATLDLKKGKNTFDIKAKNKDGEDSAKRDIQWGNGGTGRINSRNGNGNNASGGSKSRKG